MVHFNNSFIDPRAAETRRNMRAQDAKDICSGTMRIALHLSDLEHDWLRINNPDTLGHLDSKLSDDYWRQFCESSYSNPYKIRSKL